MVESLTEIYSKRKPHPLLVKYKAFYSPVEPRDKYILLGLLKTCCRMGRSPFFYLCINSKSVQKKSREDINETRFRLISRLLEVVEETRKKVEEENEGSALAFLLGLDRPYMEETFNYTHPKTGYTPLHWLAF
mmetsp:Transcript_17365/g.26756  ORF Transcript_17365/g.26756 Transcript_17365/m.26756 type:complete len:133 (+) Transcript_17365:123-521(+)